MSTDNACQKYYFRLTHHSSSSRHVDSVRYGDMSPRGQLIRPRPFAHIVRRHGLARERKHEIPSASPSSRSRSSSPVTKCYAPTDRPTAPPFPRPPVVKTKTTSQEVNPREKNKSALDCREDQKPGKAPGCRHEG